jgi:ATP-binding cassette subfamily B protein
MADKFPFYKQLNAMDCGAACLHMVAQHYGRFFSLEYLRGLTRINIEGVSLRGISDAAEHIGMRTLGAKVEYEQLVNDIPLPLIAHWRDDHFIVVYKINKDTVWVADPAHGKLKYTKEEFLSGWLTQDYDPEIRNTGTVLVLEKTPVFDEQEDVKTDRGGFSYLYAYAAQYKKLILQLIVGLALTSVLSVLFPFMVQMIVDEGIMNEDMRLLYTVGGAWFILLLLRLAVENLRGRILLHIGVRTKVSLISDFIIKVVKLPMRFFDRQMTSDLIQRIYDNERVERLLTASTLLSLFDAFTVVLMGAVMIFYNWIVFAVFAVFTAVYMIYVWRSTKKRKDLDYKRFDRAADNYNQLVELIQGMQEIKLHNAERNRRWAWERTEARLHNFSMDYLTATQKQRAGVLLLNELKNIVLIVLSAYFVVKGTMTLGMLIAVMYIISQINMPLHQLLQFVQNMQEAKVNLERMNEIHQADDEENPEEKVKIIPENGDLYFENVDFSYEGGNTRPILKNVSCFIPEGKTTAIVGGSGSGKTTMLKLLLNFYQPDRGEVKLGNIPINNFLNAFWRSQCSAVLQEGYIFSESIATNITIGEEKELDQTRLFEAVRVANIKDFIESLPQGYDTKIGANGMGLSQGQKQRILIARAIYKNPKYIFLDEATNALDAENESLIVENLNDFLRRRTVVVIAHRLSTVRNADNIIVIEDGRIVEQGPHEELLFRREKYYNLVKQQLKV